MNKVPTVVNLRTSDYDIYIGRPSVWGNPFTIGKDGTRKEVIEKYRLWFNHRVLDLRQLEGKVLGCFCKPLPCHGDILVELFKQQVMKSDNDRDSGEGLEG